MGGDGVISDGQWRNWKAKMSLKEQQACQARLVLLGRLWVGGCYTWRDVCYQ